SHVFLGRPRAWTSFPCAQQRSKLFDYERHKPFDAVAVKVDGVEVISVRETVPIHANVRNAAVFEVAPHLVHESATARALGDTGVSEGSVFEFANDEPNLVLLEQVHDGNKSLPDLFIAKFGLPIVYLPGQP